MSSCEKSVRFSDERNLDLTDVNFRVMTFSGAFLVQRQFLSGASKDISPGQDYLEESEN